MSCLPSKPGQVSERLQRLLGTPELQRLRRRLQRRFESGNDTLGIISLSKADASERQAIEQLLGRAPGRGVSLQVPLAELERVVQQAGAARDLRSAIEALCGPLTDRRAVAERSERQWRNLFAEHRKRADQLSISSWLGDLQTSGLLKRLAGNEPQQARVWLEQSLQVVAGLPGHGQTLSTLAATLLGDAHALDRGRPLTALVRQAVACKAGQRPEDERALWASVGILIGGELSSKVLVLNLPTALTTTSGRILALLREDGQPAWLSLRQLVRDPPRWQVAGRLIHVCENPAVVSAAANELAADSAALVCTYGQPGAAVTTLLRQLGAAGAKLQYHGDFDWPGIRIANRLMQAFAARPWRFDSASYRAGLVDAAKPLCGEPVAACWDADLSPAMQAAGLCLEEEQVLPQLLHDLAAKP